MAFTFEDRTGPAGGLENRTLQSAQAPDGILLREKILPGPMDKACYFAQMQKYDVASMIKDCWPDGANRIQPLAVDDFKDLRGGGTFLLIRRKAGDFLALLPLVGQGSMAWLESDGEGLILAAGNLGTGALSGEIPLLAWAIDSDVYAAARRAWLEAIRHPLLNGAMRQRSEKVYPPMLEYLGWCSWEEYRKDIDEDLLLQAAQDIEASPLPIRYMLVDEGHLDQKDGKLMRFEPDPEKFPNGWEGLLARRNDEGLRWFGLWLNFNGYWDGVSPDHQLDELSGDLQNVQYVRPRTDETIRTLLPADGAKSSFAFYDGMIGQAARAGFDFVKVDNQAANLYKYRGTCQPVRKACENSQALEGACALHTRGLINCMSHNSVCAQNAHASAVNRCSEDYAVGDLGKARRHLHNSYANMAWLGHTMWGDHDMFHSNDPVSGKVMAVSKAVSAGPVYLSDNPKDFVAENVLPLCDADGRLLRPLAPACATPESLFIDPFAEARAFRAIAPLPGGAAALVVYNLTEPVRPVTGWVEPADHASAGALLQETPWPGADELLIYDWHEGRLLPAERFEFELPDFGDRLFFLCPVHAGWALIGRTDRYLSPASAEILRARKDLLVLGFAQPGPFLVYSSPRPQALQNCQVSPAGQNLWTLEPQQQGPGILIASR